MSKVKSTIYIEADTEAAVRDYARRKRISIGQATNDLLRRALFGELSEGTEAMLVPAIRQAAAEAARQEIRDQIPLLLDVQTNRLVALLITSGRDAHTARKLARECLEAVLDDPRLADEMEQDAWLASRTRYTRDGLRREAADAQPRQAADR